MLHVTEQTQQRFKVVDSLAALPGECFFCRSPSRKLYIDPNIHVEFHGAMYICVDDCLREFADVAGWLSDGEGDTLREENARLKDEIRELRNQRAELLRITDALHDTWDSVLPAVEPDIDFSPVTEEDAGTETEGNDTIVSDNDGPAEQINDKGVVELRSVESGDKSDYSFNF